MGKVFKTVFGGKDTSQQGLQREDNRQRQDFIEERERRARSDVLRAAPAADDNRNAAFQEAINTLSQTTPAQINALQHGGMLAQSALLGGLGLTQDALLGNPINVSGFEPRRVQVDTSLLNRRLPQFTTLPQALGQPNFEEAATLRGIQSDADLFQAAQQGLIPNISAGDREFFGNLLAGSPEFFNTSRFVNDPRGQQPQIVGNAGSGLTPGNQTRISNLLSQFDRFKG